MLSQSLARRDQIAMSALSPSAKIEFALVRHKLASGTGAILFPGRHPDKPIAGEMLRHQLRKMGCNGITVHGFRSSFRDWAAERTGFDRHAVEQCLAHKNGDKTEAAYLRSDVMQKRRAIMSAWAQFCTTPPAKAAGNVTTLRRGA